MGINCTCSKTFSSHSAAEMLCPTRSCFLFYYICNKCRLVHQHLCFSVFKYINEILVCRPLSTLVKDKTGRRLINPTAVGVGSRVLYSLTCCQSFVCSLFNDTVMQHVSIVPGSQESSSSFLLLLALENDSRCAFFFTIFLNQFSLAWRLGWQHGPHCITPAD